jgi:quinol monooxygenase YgiN
MIVVSGVVTVEHDDREAAVAAVTRLAAATRDEEGCLSYAFWSDLEDPGRFRVFEEWQSDEALARHFEQPHMAEFRRAMAAVKVLSREIKRYEVAAVSAL